MQKWPVLPESNVDYSNEVRGYGCEEGNLDTEDHDDFIRY